MILHLFDDEKIVNRTVEKFEKVFPAGNIFICFVKDDVRLVNSRFRLYFYKESQTFDFSILKNVKCVIIHYLHEIKIKFVLEYIYPSIPCYWVIWGGDLYNNILAYRGYPLYFEDKYLEKKNRLNQYAKRILLKLGIYPPSDRYLLNFIRNRITHFVTDVDFEILKKYLGKNVNGIQVKGYWYYPIESILGDLINSTVKGNLIWVGNSASYTNNHLYAFEFLSQLDIKNRIITTPLSYGGSIRYRKDVQAEGRRIWGENFQGITTFLPLLEYNELMSLSEICIFPSWRQEAFGNIVVALYLGAKVFLSNKSSLVEYFQSQGISIYILEDISQKDLDTSLPIDIKKKNRQIIYSLLNENVILERIKNIWGDYTD